MHHPMEQTPRPETTAPLARLADLAVDGDRLTQTDLDRAAVCLRHFVGCALHGRDLPWSRSARALAAASQVAAQTGSTVIGLAQPTTTDLAIFANAVLGQSTLAEDVHIASLVHPGSIVIPAALAAAEHLDADTDALLKAICVGYDVVAIVGAALKTPEFARRGLRPSGIFGPFGAAAAVASLLGHDHTRTMDALAIAGNLGAGLREWASAGTTDIYVQNGVAARNGYLAAVLAGQGFTGPSSVLEGAAGLANAVSGSFEWSVFADLIGRPTGVHGVEFKRFPACSGVQAVLELAVRTAAELAVAPEEIRAVTVHTHHHGKTNPGCDSAGPWPGVGQAQMSNQAGVAMALLGAPLRIADYLTMSGQTDVLALAQRVRVVEDPALTAAYPGRSGARLVIETTDGHTLEREIAAATGLTDREVAVFVADAIDSINGDRPAADDLRDRLDRLMEPRPVRDLLAALRGS